MAFILVKDKAFSLNVDQSHEGHLHPDRLCTRVENWLIKVRILDDPSKKPVVMTSVPDLIGLLCDSCSTLFILPQ